MLHFVVEVQKYLGDPFSGKSTKGFSIKTFEDSRTILVELFIRAAFSNRFALGDFPIGTFTKTITHHYKSLQGSVSLISEILNKRNTQNMRLTL